MGQSIARRLGLASIAAAGGCAPAGAPPAVIAEPATHPAIEIVVAATTDVHGRLVGWDYFADAADPARGLSRVATVADSLRAAHPGRVILVDAGDLLQGTPLTLVAARVRSFDPHPVVAAMNAAGYDAAAIGNHEFNYGVPFLDSAIVRARFPFLAANATAPDGGGRYRAWTIVERAGVKVGIVGATNPGSMVWDRDHLAGRVVIGDIVAAVRRAALEARAAGAEAVVAVVHSGLDGPSSYDTAATGLPAENVAARIARDVEGVDLVVYGHSHREMADTTIGSTLLVQPKNYATSVAVATLAMAGEPGRRQARSKRGELVPMSGRAESPAVLAAVDDAHRAAVRFATTPIGTTPVAWRADSARVADAPITDFVLETMRRAAGADLAASAAFSLRGSLDSGAITVAELARIYPYENTLRAIRVSGRQLREFLEYSARYYRVPAAPGPVVDSAVPGYNFDIVAGADYVLDLSRPIGARVAALSVSGGPVADTDSFTLALNNYRQTGGGGFSMLRGAPVVYDRQEDIRQLLIDEVRRRGVIRPSDYARRNWRLEPASVIPRILVEQRREIATFEDGRPSAAIASSGRAPLRLRIIATNDIHGALEPRADARGVVRGGLAHLAGVADSLARACPPPCEILLLDGGDMFQGTPASNFLHGKPVVDAMNRMGYAAAALGNHEFDWGQDTLRARMRDARFSILAANVRDSAGRDVAWIPNDTIVSRGGVAIGIIGVAHTKTPSLTKRGRTAGLRFDPPAPIVDSIARSLRARGAQVVVVVGHIGAFCDRTGARECEGDVVALAAALRGRVDAIVSGHTHSRVDAVIAGIPIVQAFSRTTAIAVLDLLVPGLASDDPGKVVEVRPTTPASPAVDSIARAAVARVAPLVGRRIGTIADAMPKEGAQFALGNLIADAQRAAAGADLAVMNNGGIRAGLAAGPATWGALYEVQPFGNALVVATMTGEGVRRYLERLVGGTKLDVHLSGATVRYDPSRPSGSRILSITLPDGRPLDPATRYRFAMSDFIATGGDEYGLRGEAEKVEPTELGDLDALIAWIERQPGAVRAPRDERLIAVTR